MNFLCVLAQADVNQHHLRSEQQAGWVREVLSRAPRREP
jgi:hypothetical protein